MTMALRRKEAILRASSFAAQSFLRSIDWREIMPIVLEQLGQAVDASRVYYFSTTHQKGGNPPLHTQEFEWCGSDIEPQLDNTHMRDLRISDLGLGVHESRLLAGEATFQDVAVMPSPAREILQIQGICSIVVVPVMSDTRMCGFLGFDECRAERVWEQTEIEALRLAADVLGAAIARRRADEALRRSESELRALFDAMRDAVFVINRAGIYVKVMCADQSLLIQPDSALLGRPIDEFFDPATTQIFRDALDQVLESRSAHTLEYKLDLSEGARWFRAVLTPLDGDTVLWVARDETEQRRARQALDESAALFRLIAEASTDAICMLTARGEFVYVSPVIERLLGHAPESLLGRDAFALLHPNDAPVTHALFQEIVREVGQIRSATHRMRHHEGHWVWMETSARSLKNGRGEIEIHAISRDVTARRLAEDALREAEGRYRSIFENAVEGIFQSTPDGRYLSANPSLARIYGFTSPGELIEQMSDIGSQLYLLEHKRAEFIALMERDGEVANFEAQIRRKDGAVIWTSENARAVLDENGLLRHYEGTVEDITARKSAEEQLVHDALHDRLTGLSNRVLFMDRLAHALARVHRNRDGLFAVLFLDFDRFKNINDSLGHMAGDQLLIDMAQRLQECLRPGDTVSRLGGDEFAILLEDLSSQSEAVQVAERVQATMGTPFSIGGQNVFSSASIGIALASPDYQSPEELLRDADVAMYRAKALGKARHVIFDAGMHTRAVALLQLETDLRWAIERQEFELHYQPIVDLRDGAVRGFEALLRWNHPERGLVSPSEFVTVAEETGWIVPLGRWVVEEACAQLVRWQKEFPASQPLSMSVNFSVKQFTQTDIVPFVRGVLERHDLLPSCLKIEITESALMEGTLSVAQRLQDLRELGVQLGLDDFGTGYSSLSYLHRFSLETLKIDRSFIVRLGEGDSNLEIVRTILSLGTNLRMEVVAEGIETYDQLQILRALGCRFGQGYFFSCPLNAQAARALLGPAPPWRRNDQYPNSTN